MKNLGALVSFLALAASGCSIGEGEGTIRSERLFIRDCWRGPFDLKPTFFAANPFKDSMMIRVQRGENLVEVSDGVILVVNDVTEIREERLGERLRLGLPPGVSPVGVPEQRNPDPAKVSLSLYLYDTCHLQNGALYAVDGWVTFDSLFSGNLNEERAQDRLTEATFEALVVDPRDIEVGEDGSDVYPEGATSTVTGDFRFFFQRGTPAQPFP